MSRTDKDAPSWVRNLDAPIEHDHSRTTECIVSDDQRERWSSWRHHYSRNCAKRVTTTFFCTKDDPYRGRGVYSSCRAWDAQTCWTFACECPIPPSWKTEPHDCTPRRVQCIGHTRVERDDSVPCVCDDRPPAPTCFPGWEFGRYSGGGVPSRYVSTHYHRPERARTRALLSDARRLYNSAAPDDDAPEDDDFDFPNYQARNSMRWMYF